MNVSQHGLQILPLSGMPMILADDDLPGLLIRTMQRQNIALADGDVLVIAQKIVSKAENRLVRLADVVASQEAQHLARKVDKDERLVELILRESDAVVRAAPGVLIVRNRLGLVCANAGIDQSNVDHSQGDCALLLPVDPDSSASRLRVALEESSARRIGVVISDSVNRPWRLGSVAISIGSSGIGVLDDRRGQVDAFGRELKVTMSNIVDSIATAASLVMGETTEKIPAVIVRGVATGNRDQKSADCVRPVSEDLFL